MQLRLHSFRYVPRQPGAGWGSGTKAFGEFLTVIHGRNGSGKTPIMKGVYFAFGLDVQLPDAVRANCCAVELDVECGKRRARVRRTIFEKGGGFEASVVEGEKEGGFNNEGEMSDWLFEFVGWDRPTLTGINNAKAEPYNSHVFPVFAIDQDLGWFSVYGVKNTYIKSQHQEALRIIFGLAPKNAHERLKAYEKIKREHRVAEHLTDVRTRALNEMRSNVERGDVGHLEAERAAVERLLGEYQNGFDALRNTASQFDEAMAAAETEVQQLRQQKQQLTSRQARVEKAIGEVAAEAEIAAANATSSRAFRVFCSSPSCRMFAGPEATFGKRLLYLGDQLKDLKTSLTAYERDEKDLVLKISEAEKRREAVALERATAVSKNGPENLIASINQAAARLAEVSSRLEFCKRFADEQRELGVLIERRNALANQVLEMKPKGARPEGIAEVAEMMGECLTNWIGVLGTPNVGLPATVNADFDVQLGGESFRVGSSHSGSTRARIVLAFHAAVVEVSLRLGGRHPGVLLLDAPRQHELAEGDLVAYVNALRDLSERLGQDLQVVLAASDLKVDLKAGDAVWEPTFDVGAFPHFLGPSHS